MEYERHADGSLIRLTDGITQETDPKFNRFEAGDLSNAERLPYLPPEVIAEVLLWLPVKSLLKFRCVSKLWLSLISGVHLLKSHSKSPSIITQHSMGFSIQHIDCSLNSLTSKGTCGEVAIDFPTKMERNSVSIVDSCNGLVCIARDECIFLCNPATRESKMLPHVEIKSGFVYVSRLFGVGFGFDESKEDYKLVRMATCCAKGSYQFERMIQVYSLKTDSWKYVENSEKIQGYFVSCRGKFVDGKMYWLMAFYSTYGSQIVDLYILCVDVKTETHEKIYSPLNGVDYRGYEPTMGVLDGHLCVVANPAYPSPVSFWILNKYKSKQSWSKMFCIQSETRRRWYSHVTLLYKLSNSELLIQCRDVIAVYNTKDKSLRHTALSRCSSAVYFESMVSPTRYHKQECKKGC